MNKWLIAPVFAVAGILSSPAQAQADKCLDVLKIAQEIYQYNQSEYAKNVIALEVSEQEAKKTSQSAASTLGIVYEGIPINSTFNADNKADLQKALRRKENYESIRDNRVNFLMMRPSPVAIQAWSECRKNDTQPFILRVEESPIPNEVNVLVSYRGGQFLAPEIVIAGLTTGDGLTPVIDADHQLYAPREGWWLWKSTSTPGGKIRAGSTVKFTFRRPDPSTAVRVSILAHPANDSRSPVSQSIFVPGLPKAKVLKATVPKSLLELKASSSNLGVQGREVRDGVATAANKYPDGITMNPRDPDVKEREYQNASREIFVTYPLNGQYADFSAVFANIDPNTRCEGSAQRITFEVFADGKALKWSNGSLIYGLAPTAQVLQTFSRLDDVQELKIVAKYNNGSHLCASGLVAQPLLYPN